ncbi:MAG: class I SAM-dependent methyltransferase [Myxococcales bacterium]|nr:MAG: class I SAM-dependent methyltransferase [Myxococcales bacterium]
MDLRCRHCGTILEHTFVDLGSAPPCQRHLAPAELDGPELHYPLHVRVCHVCFLVQLPEVLSPVEIFGGGDYAYFSAYSESWVAHAARYADEAIRRLRPGARSRVIEIASNDGYLLQHFAARGIEVLGVEPASNCAAAARTRGVPSIVAFFGEALARRILAEQGPPDLVVANNVLAHVPDLNDFVGGLAALLSAGGVATLEFPHLLRLVEGNQFDTIYHEHYSYLGLTTVDEIFRHHDLVIFDVEELPTHGGSLRIHARRKEQDRPEVKPSVARLRELERVAGMRELPWYQGFGEQVAETKRALLSFLIEARRAGRRIAGYGAPGKGNTLLNACGIGRDFLDYTVDRNPYKQGNYLPGSRIPILAPERIFETRPDYLLILPWNIEAEVRQQMAGIGAWGGRFVIPIPELRVIDAGGER